jgi:predicted phosphodiesterase
MKIPHETIFRIAGAPRRPLLFAFYADCHGVFDHVTASHGKADAIFLLGDQTPEATGKTLEEALGRQAAAKTFWILGNHDGERSGSYLAHESMADRDIHARVVDVQGVRVAGLGGVFRGRVWMPGKVEPKANSRAELLATNEGRWRGRLPAWCQTTIFPEDFVALAGQQADILITHEAPESHMHGFREIGDLARAMGVNIILHGHHHSPIYRAEIEGEITVFGVGLMGVRRVKIQGERDKI